jgi:uncharacterized protein (TIGR03083 family)
MTLADRAPDIATAAHQRTEEIVRATNALRSSALLAGSSLPEWDRLTIICHLRFGAEALTRMTNAAIDGLPAAYYPLGRNEQRPATLRPRPDETPADVVASLAAHSEELRICWARVTAEQWNLDVVEPGDNPDLGPLPLARLPLLRLTEVEVHGTDLDLALDDWGELFVNVALPFRLEWLNTRRTNHQRFDTGLRGSWLLIANDGPTCLVSVDGDAVTSRRADATTAATATIEGTSRDLLALLLGRPTRKPLHFDGDESFARSFSAAFPGP